MNPVHNIFGLRMRLRWAEVHHLYWGFLGVLLSWWGVVSCLALNDLDSGILAQYEWLAPLLIGIEVLSGVIWFYVMCDDIYQHHRQVNEPWYHSPVHNWYVDYLYDNNSWTAKAIRNLNQWADKKTASWQK